jgi:hypothetical protein
MFADLTSNLPVSPINTIWCQLMNPLQSRSADLGSQDNLPVHLETGTVYWWSCETSGGVMGQEVMGLREQKRTASLQCLKLTCSLSDTPRQTRIAKHRVSVTRMMIGTSCCNFAHCTVQHNSTSKIWSYVGSTCPQALRDRAVFVLL